MALEGDTMDVKQLRWFQRIYLDGSIQKAARSLFVSQQAVSKALLSLEDELGVKLFKRGSKGVFPTEDGVTLMLETRDLIARLDAIAYRFKSDNRTISGSVHIGMLFGHVGAMSRLDIATLDRCRAMYPGIQLSWINASPLRIEQSILSGRMDFGFTAFPGEPQNFLYRKLFDFKWFIVMGHDHPLANRKMLEINDLQSQKLIFPKEEQFDRQQIMHALPDDAQPIFIDASPTLYDMVLQQLIPQNALMLCAEPHAILLNPALVRIVPFQTELLRSQIYLLRKRDTGLSEAAKEILRYLMEAWQFPFMDT